VYHHTLILITESPDPKTVNTDRLRKPQKHEIDKTMDYFAYLARQTEPSVRTQRMVNQLSSKSFKRLAQLMVGLGHRSHIERLMRENALRARPRRRGLPKDGGERPVIMPNVLDRQFEADRPNQKWVADFTYLWTAEGWLYVAAVIDLFSRRVVGWSMNNSMTSQLVTDALIMAIWRRGKPDALLHHSDQGSQYSALESPMIGG
jgi:hypothetical protein